MIGRLYMGRYEAKRLLGEGGMGRVYLARQFNPDRFVVVKIMHEHLADDPKFKDRFERETQTMARLKHPHAVQLLDASLDDPGGPCIVMEYIHGVGLDVLLKKNKQFTAAHVGRMIMQLCDVLQIAHDLNIIHRDLKPSNLMVADPETPDEQIKVMDFGLAKIIDGVVAVKKVTNAEVEFAIGTPSYISPEQVRGEQVDHRCDLYSVGVIAYELLSGRLPFHRESNMDLILAHATETPPTFKELGLRSWVSPRVERVVMDCLAKDPSQRPQSARELADQFEAALERSVEMPPRLPDKPPPIAKDELDWPIDPNALVFQFEAWMPQRIAMVKIRGFIHDAGGQVTESELGLIRVLLGAAAEKPARRGFSLFGGPHNQEAREPLELELRLKPIDHRQENRLQVTVVFHPPNDQSLERFGWRRRSEKLFCDVRAYLMGQTGV